VIDLLRLVLASNPAAYKSTGDKNAVVDVLFGTIENDTPWETPLPKPRETNLLLVLRTIANMFQTASGPVPAPWTSKVSSKLTFATFGSRVIALHGIAACASISVDKRSSSSARHSATQVRGHFDRTSGN
jgi:hypothetical protein